MVLSFCTHGMCLFFFFFNICFLVLRHLLQFFSCSVFLPFSPPACFPLHTCSASPSWAFPSFQFFSVHFPHLRSCCSLELLPVLLQCLPVGMLSCSSRLLNVSFYKLPVLLFFAVLHNIFVKNFWESGLWTIGVHYSFHGFMSDIISWATFSMKSQPWEIFGWIILSQLQANVDAVGCG